MEKESLIKHIIQPENSLELLIINDNDFIDGVMRGKARPGHPEGEIIYHVKEVLANVDKYCNDADRNSLRLIAMLHDTFKHKVDQTKPKSGENHHGMIARRFAEKYVKDENILTIIQLHDEAYNAWSVGDRKNDWDKAEKRVLQLITGLYLEDVISLYTTFYRCDNETGNKSQECYEWFLKQIK